MLRMFLPISSIVEWLAEHEELLDEPLITPSGELVIGLAGSPDGVRLLTGKAEPEIEIKV